MELIEFILCICPLLIQFALQLQHFGGLVQYIVFCFDRPDENTDQRIEDHTDDSHIGTVDTIDKNIIDFPALEDHHHGHCSEHKDSHISLVCACEIKKKAYKEREEDKI